MILLFDIPWKDLFSTYSAVTLAFIALIGYFIKRFFDLKSKKVEIRHSLFQQNKVTAIVYFVSSYIHMDKLIHKMWVDHKINISPHLENEIQVGLENFKVALTQLNLYLSSIEMNNFRRLFMNFDGIIDYIDKYKNAVDTIAEQENEDILQKYSRHILMDNAKLIESIGDDTRKMFHS